MQKNSREFKNLTPREQILIRPEMWIGSMTPLTKSGFIFDENNNIVFKEYTIVPALIKIIDEIIDNAIDGLTTSFIERKDISSTNPKISVEISNNEISVADNGPGIPVVEHEIEGEIIGKGGQKERKLEPELAWTRLFSGSNFNDSDKKYTVGTHGIGSKATAIFSSKFVGKTNDGKKICTVKITENMKHISTFVRDVSQSSSVPGTVVTFTPDLKRFGIEEKEGGCLSQIYLDVIKFRLFNLQIAFPKIKFVFNGTPISHLTSNNKKAKLSIDSYVYSFNPNAEILKFGDKNVNNGFVAVFPSSSFIHHTFVNGVFLSRGGTHIDFITKKITSTLREKLQRKFPNIKPHDILNNTGVIAFCNNFPNSKYDSQTKDTLTNPNSDIINYFNGVDFESFAENKIYKNEEIMAPILESFKLKEEVNIRLQLKKSTKVKIIRSDNYISSTNKNTQNDYFLICEGFSAVSGLSQALGRSGFAYYASRGVPLNVLSASPSEISKNKEFLDIMSIAGIDISFGKNVDNNNNNQNLNFKVIVTATDADKDGLHLAGVYMGWWLKFAPYLFNAKKLARLVTPYIVLWKNNNEIYKSFYDVETFRNYEKKHENEIKKYKKSLYKGLGSWNKEQFSSLFESSPHGIEDFLQYITLDPLNDKSDNLGEQYVNWWLKTDYAEQRRKLINSFNLDLEKI